MALTNLTYGLHDGSFYDVNNLAHSTTHTRQLNMSQIVSDMQFVVDTYGQVHPITSIDAMSNDIFRDEEGLAFALAEEDAEKNSIKGHILYAKVNGNVVMIDYTSSWCRVITGAIGYDSEFLKMSVLMSWARCKNIKNERLYNHRP